MNFKLFGTGLAALALLASSFSAQAADIPRPVYKGVRPVVAYYNWTGFYVGINGGYGWGTSDWSVVPDGQQQAQRLAGRRHAWLQLPGRLDRLGPRRRLRLVERQGQRRLRAGVDLRAPRTAGLPPSAAGSATPSTAGCRTSPAAAPTATSRRPSTCRSLASRLRRPATNSAGPSASASNTPSSATGAPRSNISMSISAASTPAVAPVVNNVSFKENIVRAGLNYKFSGPIFSRY